MVIDRRLPDIDGVRVLREFRYEGIDTPALTVTGHPTLDGAVEALGLDAADYLVTLAINCGAVPETLLESELFAHEKGPFTSSAARRKGLAEEADEGSPFLDKVGQMSPTMQVTLLRLLEEGSFRWLGGTELVTVDVRLVFATNKDVQFEAIGRTAYRRPPGGPPAPTRAASGPPSSTGFPTAA